MSSLPLTDSIKSGVYDSRPNAWARRTSLFFFFSFIIAIVLFGGSSRSDQIGLLILRPIAVVVAIYGLWRMEEADWLSIKPMALLLGAAMCVGLFQLVPLPPALWSALPGRDEFLATYESVGLNAPWLPISLAPTLTWNSVVSLLVPMAALISFATLPPRYYSMALFVFVLVGLASGLLGMLQLLSGGTKALHFYSISNFGSNTGFFANRNHQAVFQAALLPLVPLARSWLQRDAIPTYASNLIAVGAVAFLAMSIATTGSRAGLVLGAVGLLWAMWQLYTVVDAPSTSRMRRHRGSFAISVRAQRIAIPVIVLLLIAVVAVGPKGLGVERLIDQGGEATIEDMRFEIYDNTAPMVLANLPFGGGLGTFPYVYKGYEDPEALSYRYVNHAHNDYLEAMYEAGALACLLFAWLVVLLIHWMRLAMAQGAESTRQAIAIALSLSFIAAGSILDYPARTPLIATFTVIVLAILYNTAVIPKKARTNKH